MQFGRPDAALRPARADRQGIAYLPYGALLIGYGMMLFVALRDDSVHPWAGLSAGLILMTGAVVVRQVVAMRENHGLVIRDQLTGLANRRSAGPALTAAMDRHQQDGEASALLIIDLDGFKGINDARGHEAGDAVLVAFAAVLRDTVRASDMAARVGGDEFLVVLDRLGDARQAVAVAVAQRILDRAAQPIDLAGTPTPIRASIGVVLTDPRADVAAVRHRADMAMYAAKLSGRNRPQLWEPDLETALTGRDAFEVEVLSAAPAGQLRLHYQPIVALDTGAISGLEALVRWEHPERGLIFPDAFIPVAERTGAISEIGRWVLEEATRQVRRWQAETGRRIYVSVNVSPRQLRDGDLDVRVAETLATSGLDPHDLVLELTESALVQEADAAQALQALRDTGIRVAVDDFGTGYSSLRYLTRLPVDILKLDRCFVSELNGAPQGSAIAEAVIRLAQAMNLDTVAEGIEVPAQATELTLLGYRNGQGYHYARPLPPEEIADLLRAGVAGSDQRLRAG